MNATPANSDQRETARSLWVFTPSRTDPKDLEAILVQRHDMLKDAVERVKESAVTAHKHHLLFVGPRGCGKTHLITLIISRISADQEALPHFRLAWLNEDETCTSLLELLIKIHTALEKRYTSEYCAEDLSQAYELQAAAALDFVAQRLLAGLGSKTLVVVTENLDALFESLGDQGQKQLRAFIQEHPQLALVGTAQRLVAGLTDRASPFFGFFQTEHLKPLTVEQAITLLQNIARIQGKPAVSEFLATSRGRSRVRALHHLSGGNHRIYIVLSQFITRESLDALFAPFLKMVDELTPYYQERLRWLPTLQRKIVELLCTCEGTVPVKEIARRLFSTPQSISSQLQDLREKGYVESSQRGRESLYEISEPLMRICVEVKENQTKQPLRLLVDFLRVWYDDGELQRRLGLCHPESAPHRYLSVALERNTLQGNLRMKMLAEEVFGKDVVALNSLALQQFGSNLPEDFLLALQCLRSGDNKGALICLEEALSSATTTTAKAGILIFWGITHGRQGDHTAASDDFTRAIELPGAPPDQVATALFNRGVAHGQQGDHADEIADFTRAIELPGAPPVLVAMALVNRAVRHGRQGDHVAGIADYTRAIGLPGAPSDQVAKALVNRGVMRGQQGDHAGATADYTRVIELTGAPPDQVAIALVNLGVMHGQQGDHAAEISDYTRAIDLPGAPPNQVATALVYRGITHGQRGDDAAEIADYTRTSELPGAPPDQVARALVYRGITHGQHGDYAAAFADFTRTIELPGASPDQVAKALVNRGVTYGKQGDHAVAIADYTRTIELPGAPPNQVARALVNRGVTHGQQGDHVAEIADYTCAIELPGASPDQVARALVYRGITHGQQGDHAAAIADYTRTIELPGAPPDQVAIALVNRGIRHGEQGDQVAAIADYTRAIELPGAPPDQVALALVNRGARHGQQGGHAADIADFTRAIELHGAPPDQLAVALYNRGVAHFQAGDKAASRDDFEALISSESAPAEQIIDTLLALAELHWSDGRWKEGFAAIEGGLGLGARQSPPSFAAPIDIIEVLFSAGLSQDGRQTHASTLYSLYTEHSSQAVLGEALVKQIGTVYAKGAPWPASDNLDQWLTAWEQAAGDAPDFKLPLRLLRVGVEFIKAGGKDHGVLLSLTFTERLILRQALGLEAEEN